jgi:hypothetical protein
MTSEAVTIEEVTGSRRSVELRNRGLPYRPVAFPGRQHYVQKWYPGNPTATVQALGPREGNIELKGTWKSRYLPGEVTAVGFEDLIGPGEDMTAEILTLIFHRLRRAGNEIELRWGPEIRRGIIGDFNPTYQRVEDVGWLIAFVVSQVGDAPRRRAASTTAPQRDLNVSLVALDDILARIPIGLLPNVTAPIISDFNSIRAGTVSVNLELARIFGAPFIPPARLKNLEALIEQLLEDLRDLRERTTAGPYTAFVPVDSVDKVLAVETWRRDAGAAALLHSKNSLDVRENIRERSVPGYLARVSVKRDETLRQIAKRYYGDASSWTVIADANGLTSASVAPGTIVLVPRSPETSGSARLAQ